MGVYGGARRALLWRTPPPAPYSGGEAAAFPARNNGPQSDFEPWETLHPRTELSRWWGEHRFPNGPALSAPLPARSRQEERIVMHRRVMHLSAQVFKGNLGSRASPGPSSVTGANRKQAATCRFPQRPQGRGRSARGCLGRQPHPRLFPTPRFPEEWALDMCRFSECPNPSLGC